jgi:hypothetical protein
VAVVEEQVAEVMLVSVVVMVPLTQAVVAEVQVVHKALVPQKEVTAVQGL